MENLEINNIMLNKNYQGKRVLVTGHTGFKGSWLTAWLLKLGAKVCGLSDQIPTNPSMFVELGLDQKIENHFCDIRDFEGVSKILTEFAPDYVFHLAAQPIVSVSYEDPFNKCHGDCSAARSSKVMESTL
jgi:CDP-glucose 4,6-dehydratase